MKKKKSKKRKNEAMNEFRLGDEFDQNFDELISKGYIEQVGTDEPNAEPKYVLTEKAMRYFEQNRMTEETLKSDITHKPDTEIFMAFELNRDRAIAIKIAKSAQTYHVAFTSLEKLKKFMRNLYQMKIIHTKKFRAFPTTIEEYFTDLKAQFCNLDLIIDPSNDFKTTDSSQYMQ